MREKKTPDVEVYEAFDRARRSKSAGKELRALMERLDKDAVIVGVGRDAFPIVHTLRLLGYDAHVVLPISRTHPLARGLSGERPWEIREKVREALKTKRNLEEARKIVRMIEEAAGRKRKVIVVDTGLAGTHPLLVKEVYEALRERGETKKDLEIGTAVLGARPWNADNVDIVANVIKGAPKYFLGRWESLPKFTEMARESRHVPVGKEGKIAFSQFLLPFAKHVAHVAGLLARIKPEAALKWVNLYIRYFERLAKHPRFAHHVLLADDVDETRRMILKSLRKIRGELEGRERELGKRRGG